MKAVCYVLTVYFLSLTGVPCADSVDHSLESDIVSLSVNGNDGSHDHTGDDCSMLCGCHCCHVHVFVTRPIALGPAESASAVYIDYAQHFSATVVFPFLRPPIS